MVNDKLESVKVYDHFIYDRFIFDPDSSSLPKVDQSTQEYITNSRVFYDPKNRLSDLEELAKIKFTGRKWF